MSKIFKVVKILDDNHKIVINAGTNQGIKENQRFLVYSLDGEEIFDPDTNELLGKLEVTKGTGTVTFLQEKMCTITSDMYEETPTISITYFVTKSDTKRHLCFNDAHIGDLVKSI